MVQTLGCQLGEVLEKMEYVIREFPNAKDHPDCLGNRFSWHLKFDGFETNLCNGI